MILVLGGSGYVGQAFVAELKARGLEHRSVSRRDADYTIFGELMSLLKQNRPDFLVNAAGFTGKPNVDACENQRAETIEGNSLFPAMVAHACLVSGVRWGHVSSGCIYSGGKIVDGTQFRIQRDLNDPEVRALHESDPGRIVGFSEEDEPNFSFRNPPCSFYSGSKALGESEILRVGGAYVWRLRIPFDEFDNPRNYLSKLQRYSKVYDNINSLSHRGEFARACLDLWKMQAPTGVYNVTNPGAISARQVVDLIRALRGEGRSFEFWSNDEEFYRVAARTPRSNCVMDTTKLQKTGVFMRPVAEAVEDSIRRWVPEQAGSI